MLVESRHGAVRYIRLGAEVSGQVLYWTACFWVDGLLVDSGCAHTAEELLEHLRPLGVEVIVNTHHHEDHVGANALLVEELGAELYAPAASLALINQPPWIHQHRQVVWGIPRSSSPRPLDGGFSHAGREYQVLPAPGHCADQVMLWQESQGWLFCGDAYIAEAPRTARPEENYHHCLATIRAMAELEPKTLFSSPAGVVEPALAPLNNAIGHLEDMRGRIHALRDQGLEPVRIVKELFGRESKLVQWTEGQFSYQNFVEAFLKDAGGQG